jgi:GT2 family glycosyltransferase
MPGVRIAVVVVTHDSSDVVAGCLAALAHGGAGGVELTDVVVVDNASADDSVAVCLAERRLPVTPLRLPQNAGYAAGINAGLRVLRDRPPDAVMVLNPDTRVRPGALATLAAALEMPGRGIVAPRLVNPDGSLQPSLRRAATVRGVVAESLLGGRLADRLGVGELVFADGPHAVPGPVEWATGAALLMSWRMLQEVGPWDESFLLYSEETEFQQRAARHGWSTWFEPAAVVEHRGGESGTRPSLAALVTVNRVALFSRHNSHLTSAAYAVGLLLGVLVRAAGRRTARASLVALLMPSRRVSSLTDLR